MTENHFGPSAVNVITKTCSGEIRTVSQAQETKVHQTRSDFSVLVLESVSAQEMRVFQHWWLLGLGMDGVWVRRKDEDFRALHAVEQGNKGMELL